MTQCFMMMIVLFFITTGVLLAGCSGNSGTEMIPVTPWVPFTPVTGLDLTNQNSPLAATFGNGASRTPLGTPQPRIGLEKIAGGVSSPMMIAVSPDETGRMFVVDQIGMVKNHYPGPQGSD